MNAFQQAQQVEIAGLDDILPYLRLKSFEGRFAFTHKGNLASFLQKTVGDVVFNCPDGKIWSAELKTEQSNQHGNFFLETWSNKTAGMQTPGWMHTIRTDILLYYFVDSRELFTMPFKELWEWAFVREGRNGFCGRIWDYPEKPQGKYSQLNKTWGRCVPIATLAREVRMRKYLVDGTRCIEVVSKVPSRQGFLPFAN